VPARTSEVARGIGMGEMRRSGRHWTLVVILAVLGAGVAGMIGWRLRPTQDPLAPAEHAYENGDWQGVDRLAAAWLRASPEDRRALRLRARAAARLGHDTEARQLYARLGGAPAMQAEDLWLFGKIVDHLGSRETARECWARGLHADPHHPELLREIAVDRLETGRPIQAAQLARRLAARPGWQARGNLLLGNALAADDDPRGAAECWTRALASDPAIAREAPDLRKAVARAWLRVGEPSRARDALRPGGTAQDDPETAWLQVRSYLQERSPAAAQGSMEASRAYRRAHPLEPEPAPYVGSTGCRACHAAISDAVRSSRHSRTFQRSPGIRFRSLPDHPIADPGNPSVRHSLRREGEDLHFETRQGDRVAAAVVAYAFGSGDRGMTLVGRDDRGRTRELRLSTYEDQAVWDVTTGQTSPPQGQADHLGRVLTDDELRSCFFCHTTVARSARDRAGPESADPAIGCERCHGPGGNHVAAVSLGLADRAIARPGPDSGAAVVALCAGCHRPLGLTVTPTDPLAPRFPAAGLTWSRCYKESGAAIDCLTCHDPHHDAETSPAYYERKCLECHSGATDDRPTIASAAAESPRPSACPVDSTRGCITCHMSVTENVIPHTRFTDHHIRVRRK
jgi:tetratricopeptide (TPR) repeat protein